MVRTEWPLLYVNFSTIIDPIQRRSFVHWVLFRSSPNFLAAVFLAVTVSRWAHSVSPAIAIMSSVHVLTSYSGPLLSGLRSNTLRSRQVLLWTTSIMLVAGSSTLALSVYTYLDKLVPQPHEMVAVVWTALFATLIFSAVRTRLERNQGVMTSELISLSQDEVMQKYAEPIREMSLKYSADEALLMAIAIVENIQRPGWFRVLERKIGWFRQSGTYGIMQITSRRPIDDLESIEVSARDYFPNSASDGSESPDKRFARLIEIGRHHNSNRQFLEMFQQVLTGIIEWSWHEDGRSSNYLDKVLNSTKRLARRCIDRLQ